MIHALMSSLAPAFLALLVCFVAAFRVKRHLHWNPGLVVQLLAPALFAALAAPLVQVLDGYTHGLLGAAVLILLVALTLSTLKALRPGPA